MQRTHDSYEDQAAEAQHGDTDRAEPIEGGVQGHVARFWRDENGDVWEEILYDANVGTRRSAPPTCLYAPDPNAKSKYEGNNDLLEADIREALGGEFPFNWANPRLGQMWDMYRVILQQLREHACEPCEDMSAVPKAYQIHGRLVPRRLLADHDGEIAFALAEDPNVFNIAVPFDTKVKDEKLPEYLLGGFSLNPEIFREVHEGFGYDEYLNPLDEDSVVSKNECNLVRKPTITAEQQTVVSDLLLAAEPKPVEVPRENPDSPRWVWVRRWQAGDECSGWVFIPEDWEELDGRPDIISDSEYDYDAWDDSPDMLIELELNGVTAESLGIDPERACNIREKIKLGYLPLAKQRVYEKHIRAMREAFNASRNS